jgi:succinate dehydrogenase / fumarate reductase cytochrome b subunit
MSASYQNPHFLLRRLHSLLGLLPAGGFLIFHMWENSQSRYGAEYYNHYIVEKIQGMNYVHLAEIFVIALPILFHTAYGVVIWWQGKSNVMQFGYMRNWAWWVQRLSGFAIFAFLIYHVGWTRIWAEFEPVQAKNMYLRMQVLLNSPASAIAYILGMVFALYHLCNGLWTMGITWGLLTTAKAQKQAQLVALALFGVLVFFGIHSLLGFGMFGMDPILSVNPLTAAIGG